MTEGRAQSLEIIEYRLKIAEDEIKKLHAELDSRAAEEKKRLFWGISVLGTVVIAMATVIWNWRSVILRGTQ